MAGTSFTASRDCPFWLKRWRDSFCEQASLESLSVIGIGAEEK